MKYLLKTLLILLVLALIISPIAITAFTAFSIPPQYSDTFVGILDEKYERLTSIKEEKIVIVGGSSTVFGFESKYIEKYFGRPVVNFGLYAALGTKIMLDLSRPGINEGDIVILAPELDPQTLSLYFNAETALQATDDDPSMLLHTDRANWGELISSLFSFAAKKYEYYKKGAPKPTGAYSSKNFNAQGDLDYPRDENIMELYYDPNKSITLDESILSDEFFDYVNEYIAYCESRGADVYFSYCPMNKSALADGTTEESIACFESALKGRLDCDVIGYIDDYIMVPGYFYDSNFHLNNAGAVWRTLRLCEDLILATDTPAFLTDEYPEAPSLDEGMIQINEKIQDDGYFTYEKLPSGNYMIEGLTDLGKTQSTLTVPLGVYSDTLDCSIAVTLIGKGAFDGCSATKIIIPEDTYVTQMNNGAFEGASTVKDLYIYKFEESEINPPESFAGTAEGFVVHVPVDSIYKEGYYWSQVNNLTIVADIEN